MLQLNRSLLTKAVLATTLVCLYHSAIAPSANSAPREVTITLAADDNISGVAFMQIAENKDNPPAAIAFSRTSVVTTEASVLYVRVQDRALNWSAWVEVQVGAAPIIRDPLAKTVYVPVELVPYVPPPPTTPPTTPPPPPPPTTPPTTPPPPVSPPTGVGTTPSVEAAAPGGFSAPPAVVAIPLSETVTASTDLTQSETLTASGPVVTLVPDKAAPVTPLVEKITEVTPPATVEPKVQPITPQKPAGVKSIPTQTKASVSINLSSQPSSKVTVGVNKVLEIKMPTVTGTTSVKASVKDAAGKSMTLDVKVDKKSGKITIPKLTFSKKGTYQVTTTVGKKITKLTIVVP
jgi:hypothetical protein